MEKYFGPKNQYYSVNSYYRRLVDERSARVLAPRLFRDLILNKSFCYKCTLKFKKILEITAPIIGVLVIFTYFSGEKVASITILSFTLLFGGGLYSIVIKYEQLIRNKIFTINNSEISILDEQSNKAENEILENWDNYNVNYIGYPADWVERRAQVKSRDLQTCQKCNWPNGTSKRRRNLHVHHIARISQGGNNSISNLITLCHICHRSEDGVGHQLIYYKRKKRR